MRLVRSGGSVAEGEILQMKTASEIIGTALKIGGVSVVLILVVTLSALIVSVEVCFALLMSWTTLLREKMMTAYDWIVLIFNRCVTSATTSNLLRKGVSVEMMIDKLKMKLKI